MESPVSIYAAPATDVLPSTISEGTLTLVEIRGSILTGRKLIVPGQFTFPGICLFSGRSDDLGPLITRHASDEKTGSGYAAVAGGLVFWCVWIKVSPAAALIALGAFAAILIAFQRKQKERDIASRSVSYRTSISFLRRRRAGQWLNFAAAAACFLMLMNFGEVRDLLRPFMSRQVATFVSVVAMPSLFIPGLALMGTMSLKLRNLKDGHLEITGIKRSIMERIEAACRVAVAENSAADQPGAGDEHNEQTS